MEWRIPVKMIGPPTPPGVWPTRYRFAFGAGNTTAWQKDKQLARAIPYLPVWPGLIANTIFYGAIFWLLCAGWSKCRSMRRLARQQCPRCAYPLGATGACPECGAPHSTPPIRAHLDQD